MLELRSLNVRFWGLLSLDGRSLLFEGLERGELSEIKREGDDDDEDDDVDEDEDEDEKLCEVEEV